MATSPSTHPELYESIKLGNSPSPGRVTLSGHDRKQKWEIQNPKGTTGFNEINHGQEPMTFTATFYLVDLDDVQAWEDFLRVLRSAIPIAGGKPKALPIYHPDLARQQISDVVCETIGGLTHDDKGGATVSVTFLEYRPHKPRPATKPAARQGVTTLDPNAAAKRELSQLLEQAKGP